MKEIQLILYHKNECDRKRCTGLKLARFGHVTLVKSISGIKRCAIGLSPLADKVFSKLDLNSVLKNGLVVVDCSWKSVESTFYPLRKVKFRRLPYLIPVNPTNFGKPFMLSSVEAFAAALYILGHKDKAKKILMLFKWGMHFLELNKDPLEEYSKCSTREEIIEKQKLFI